MNHYIIVSRERNQIENLCIIIVPSSVVSLLLFRGQNQPTNKTNRAVEMELELRKLLLTLHGGGSRVQIPREPTIWTHLKQIESFSWTMPWTLACNFIPQIMSSPFYWLFKKKYWDLN
jgi:hypothetical protein